MVHKIESDPVGGSIDGISGACGSNLDAIDFLSKCWKSPLKNDKTKNQRCGRRFFQTMKEDDTWRLTSRMVVEYRDNQVPEYQIR